ncbi:hypothetical protein [Streptomyces sp. V1I1]|uniref:hypothetical protein n=1 Tax=Streptomyces sp. V1I1 TaxID=3042272 RepID=UPI00278717AC|nr:hypothetical protein [Streptomyces sp. V1I1]MDQ0945893.1 hypothetical protein [Streptomyces sp. V1I1]
MYTEGSGGEPSARKVDLAVVERPRRRSRYAELPQGVIEFKAVHSYEAHAQGHLNQIEKLVKVDVLKSMTWDSCVPGDVYAVVLLPHMNIVNERKLADHVMKGSDKIRLNDLLRQAGRVSDTAVQGVALRLAPLGPVRDGALDGGTEYGVHVTVSFVILGPVPIETFETLDRPL